MPRPFNEAAFRKAFDELVVRGHFNEEPSYYPRYHTRYSWIIKKFAAIAPPPPCSVLDIGGGQLAVLANTLWADNCTATDIGGDHLNYVASLGVRTGRWNLCSDEQPFTSEFDFIFFSEVIEHLPIPGHIVLERLRKSLKPGGILLCTTPNLYRLRNVVYIATGTQLFDNFRMPDEHGLGHMLEYTKPHLQWQFQRSGFTDIEISLQQFRHNPRRLVPRLLSWGFYPLFLVPRFRDNLVAIARAPSRDRAQYTQQPVS